MRICFNQPAFIPWGGFFCRLMSSDAMVLLDHTWFARGFTFVNRNRIKGPGGELWTTVPLVNLPNQRQNIKGLKIHEKEYWAKKWLATLYHAYNKSIHYREIVDELRKILERKDDGFVGMIYPIFNFMKSALGINTPFLFQSDLGIESRGDQLLLDVAVGLKATEMILPYFSQSSVDWKRFENQKIKVRFLHYFSPVYPQFWGGYLRNLSALDLLFCMGHEGRQVLEKGYKIISL
jgi:hypothetical protein